MMEIKSEKTPKFTTLNLVASSFVLERERERLTYQLAR